jgi:hypothetical protein
MLSESDSADTGGVMDRIDVDAALDQLIFPPTPTVNKHLRKAYVTSTYDFFRSNPGESYSIGGLRPHIIDGTKIDGKRTPMLPGKWYRQMVAPHLHWLPGVTRVDGGSAWMFDTAVLERPAVPDDPVDPPEDDVKDRIRNIDLPGRSHRLSIKHFCAVRDIYFQLQDQGTATRDELWQLYNPNTWTAPKDGKYGSGREWWAGVGRHALEDLPGIDPPIMPAGEWRYLGVQRDER